MEETPSPSRTGQQFTLASGRKLGFAEYGDARGAPVLYCHGWPGSRLEAQALHSAGTALGVRIVAVDRPGYGLSDFQPGRTLASWAADIGELAGGLRLDRFAVLGVSGGGPFAMACAAGLGERLSRVLLVCALGPTDVPGVTRGMVFAHRWLLWLGRKAPALARPIGRVSLKYLRRYPDRVVSPSVLNRLPASDREAMQPGPFQQALTAGFREGLRDGVEGAVVDGTLYAKPWGFRLEEVRAPVRLWHGEADIIVPPAMGRHYARVLPNCRATFHAGEGHFSLARKFAREVVAGAKA